MAKRRLERVALSELAEVNPKTDISGLDPNSLVSFIPMADVSESGKWNGQQVRELQDVRVGYTPFAEGDILFAKITPCMENGKGAHVVGLRNGVGFGSTEFHVLRAVDGNDPRFIFYWLQDRSTRSKAIAFMGGSAGQQRVQAGFFSRYQVPFIEPLEQPRIANILDTIDDAIAKTEAVIAKLKQIRSGLLHDLLTCGLDENGQLRDPIAHPEQFKESPLGRIPKEWNVVPVEQVGAKKRYAIVDGPFGSNLKTIHYRKSGIPVIQSGYVTSGEFVARGYFYVGEDLFLEQTRSAVEPGDIVMAKIGAQCGACARLPSDHSVGILAGNSLKISTDAEICRADYLVHVFHYCYAIGRLDQVRSETAQPAISLKSLRSFVVPCPSVSEQDAVIECINQHKSAVSIEHVRLSKLKSLKYGLMDDLLTGRVDTRLDMFASKRGD